MARTNLQSSGTRSADGSFNDAYVWMVSVSLSGYAVIGKGFAYIGVPPLFVGEILLLVGLIALIQTQSLAATFVPIQNQILVVLMAWVIMRTIPFVSEYGVDALRDSVIVVYGLFSFIVVGLLIAEPNRLDTILARYSSFAWLYGLIGGPLFLLTKLAQDRVPNWPWSGTPIYEVRPGEAAVHVAGATIFVLLGLRKVSLPWVGALLFGIALLLPSRGGMLACMVPTLFAAILGNQLRKIARVALLMLALLGSMAAIGVSEIGPPNPDGSRRGVGLEQIIDNVNSIFSESKAANLDGTKTWRLQWWEKIQDYTIRGPYFWAGKGFGINLSIDDGISDGRLDRPLLRSPHSANMTVLARAGVPGLALWAVLLASWFVRLTFDAVHARRRGDIANANLLLWIVSYGGAIVIDASFDVALEGPMLGIWFWCLFGFGIAASMIYRASLTLNAREYDINFDVIDFRSKVRNPMRREAAP